MIYIVNLYHYKKLKVDFHVSGPAQFYDVTAARITNNFIQDSYENEIKKFEFNI